MGINILDDRIHIIDNLDVRAVMRDIATSKLQEDAFFICNIADIVRKCIAFKELLPRVIPHYAVKCNDDRVILKTIAAMGVNFDCASVTEMQKVLQLGVDHRRIIYANPNRTPSAIRFAMQNNIDLLTFDNECELHKFKEYFPSARCVIRIKYDDVTSLVTLGAKFGCDPMKEAPQLLDTALKLGINVVGVCFHVGSGCTNPSIFKGAIAAARHVFNYADSIGFKFTLLDVGGGFSGFTGTTLHKVAEFVNEGITEHFPDPNITIYAEPGQYFVASAFTLCTNIHLKKNIAVESEKHIKYFVNDGTHGNFSAVISVDLIVDPIPLKEYKNENTFSSSVWGPTTRNEDRLVKNSQLPEMEVGDWIFFQDMGAYTTVLASEHAGFPLPKNYNVVDAESWKLLHKSTPFKESEFHFSNIVDEIRNSENNNIISN